MARKPGTFGSVEKERSGRYRARYYGPDGRRYAAPTLFLTKKDARAWLSLRHSEIIRNAWEPPTSATRPQPRLTFGDYATTWLRHRDIKTRTREDYESLLQKSLLPAFGRLPLASITADDVREWHAGMGTDTPTLRAHRYSLLRTILGDAAADGKIAANPCTIRGAGSAKRAKTIRPASIDEITGITWEMPKKYRAMVLLAGWCALRFGELTELRRRDVILFVPPAGSDADPRGVVRVERGVVRTKQGFKNDEGPKSEAGVRDVAVPPHLVAYLQRHLDEFASAPNDLLFPAAHGGHLAPSSLYRHYYRARRKVGREDLRFQDLRHSGAVLAAATGATLAELMARLGHSTPAAAMRYQHAAKERDQAIAGLLSKLAPSVWI